MALVFGFTLLFISRYLLASILVNVIASNAVTELNTTIICDVCCQNNQLSKTPFVCVNKTEIENNSGMMLLLSVTTKPESTIPNGIQKIN